MPRLLMIHRFWAAPGARKTEHRIRKLKCALQTSTHSKLQWATVWVASSWHKRLDHASDLHFRTELQDNPSNSANCHVHTCNAILFNSHCPECLDPSQIKLSQPLKLCMFAAICQRANLVRWESDLDLVHQHFEMVAKSLFP